MNKIVKKAIEQSYVSYCDEQYNVGGTAMSAHEWGWKEGYEWILTELEMNNEISVDVLEKYMKKLS